MKPASRKRGSSLVRIEDRGLFPNNGKVMLLGLTRFRERGGQFFVSGIKLVRLSHRLEKLFLLFIHGFTRLFGRLDFLTNGFFDYLKVGRIHVRTRQLIELRD